MTKAAAESVAEVDVVAMLFEPYGELTEAEQKLVEEIRSRHARAVAVSTRPTLCGRRRTSPCAKSS